MSKNKFLVALTLTGAMTLAGCTSTPTRNNASAQGQDSVTVDTTSVPTVAPQTQQQATVTVKSNKMNRDIDNTITVPQSYLAHGDTKRYPVVYLLHGHGDANASWPVKYDLKEAANKYGVIIVCPDGQNSWYFDSPIDSTMQFETYVSKELVAFMDHNYRTLANRTGRAITGLSMGGHGALWLAFRHPDVFGSCGSMSGGVDITKFPDRWDIDKRLGKYEQNKQVWTDHAVINQLDKLKPGQLNIIIDDGRQDFFYEVNMALHAELDKRGIKHDFTIRPGQHSWKYWCTSLPLHLDFFAKAFAGKPIECKTNIDNSNPQAGKEPVERQQEKHPAPQKTVAHTDSVKK